MCCGGRAGRASTETWAPGWLKTPPAPGPASGRAVIAPHPSDPTWPKDSHRTRSIGRTFPTASETSGNIRRGPRWNSIGSSASIRYWLKVRPPGTASATNVERRYTPAAISCTEVCMGRAWPRDAPGGWGGAPPIWPAASPIQHAVVPGQRAERGPVPDAGAVEQAAQVPLDRLGRQVQRRADLAGRAAACHQAQDVELAPGDPERAQRDRDVGAAPAAAGGRGGG